MTGQWGVLAARRLRETWNHRLRFGRSGVWLILLDVIGPLTFIFWLSFVLPSVAYQQLPAVLGFLAVMNLLVGFGNSYNRAEAILFSNEARLDLLLARPVDVVQSAVIITYLDNLRPGMQTPLLIALVLAYHWFPGNFLLLLSLIIVLPFFCAATGVLAVILVKRLMSKISGLFFILASLILLSGLAGAIWPVMKLIKGGLFAAALFKLPFLQPVSWWFCFFLLAGIGLILIARKLAVLWEEALLLQEEQTAVQIKNGQARWLMGFLSALHLPSAVESVMLKEWLSLQRSPLTKFRMIAWLILSVVPFLHPGLRSLVISLPSPLITIFVIWVFCFGELIATAYQSEADRLGLLWLAAVKPGQLALGKFLAYLPLAMFALGNAGIVVFVSGLRGEPALFVFMFTFIGVVSAIVLSLVPAALSMNRVFYRSGSISDMTLEQVPVTLPSLVSFFVLLGFLAAYCYIIVLIQSGGMISLASVAGVLAGGVVSAVLAIAVTNFLLKGCYSL